MDWGVPTLDPKRNKQSDYFKSLYGAEDNTLEIDDNSRATPPLSNPFINKGQLDDIPSLFNPIRTSSASTSPNSRRSSRFFSNSSSTSPKMHNIKESPPKRFTKARLNNVENRDYLIESPTSIYRSLPPIPSPTERAITRGMEEMSILDSPTTPQSTTASFFKMPMISPSSSDPQIKKKKSYSADSPTSLNKRSSTIFSMDFDEMPLDMQIICDARTSGYVHDMDVFVNQSYGEFWELSMDEGKCYKQWSKSQFETQSLLFEILMNLKKIKFNLHRLIFIYGRNLKDDGVISIEEYEKTFGVLTEFYYFLETLLKKKLKPLFDNTFFVDDHRVLKHLANWFNQLNDQYLYISKSVVFLSKLATNEDVRNLILGISKQDIQSVTNRSAVSPLDLFSSYFIKLFTSIEMLFDRLKSVYKESKNINNFDLTFKLKDTLKKINSISDSTSDFQKKINFNEKLTFMNQVDYSHFQMIGLFDHHRKFGEPLQLEVKSNLTWHNASLVAFDNYLAIFSVKSGILNTSSKDEYTYFKQPIPIQYLQFDTFIENEYKIIMIKDIGNKSTHQFRRINDVTIAILDRFLKDIIVLQNEFWEDSINSHIQFKVFNSYNFLSKPKNYYPYVLEVPSKCNILENMVEFGQDLDIDEDCLVAFTDVLSCDYFTSKSCQPYEKFVVLGTKDGIYMGKLNKSKSFKKVHKITNIKKLVVLNNEVIFCIGNESLYHLSISKLYEAYQKSKTWDINIFEENKRHVTDFTIGYQSSVQISGCPYLFVWNKNNVSFTELRRENDWKFNWQGFKTHYNVGRLQTVYANNFALSHTIDNYAIWNLSKLSDIRSIGLNRFDIKDITKHEVPIAIFPFPNEMEGISEILVVFSKFCTRMKNVKGKYVQSNDEIIWFGMRCESASFDCQEKVLITVNEQCIEVRSLYDDKNMKSKLIGCLVGPNIKLLNEMPGKPIFRFNVASANGEEYQRQVIFKIRKVLNK